MEYKFVVQLADDLVGLAAAATARTQFLTVKAALSSREIISEACRRWKVDDKEHNKYSLSFDETKGYLTEGE